MVRSAIGEELQIEARSRDALRRRKRLAEELERGALLEGAVGTSGLENAAHPANAEGCHDLPGALVSR